MVSFRFSGFTPHVPLVSSATAGVSSVAEIFGPAFLDLNWTVSVATSAVSGPGAFSGGAARGDVTCGRSDDDEEEFKEGDAGVSSGGETGARIGDEGRAAFTLGDIGALGDLGELGRAILNTGAAWDASGRESGLDEEDEEEAGGGDALEAGKDEDGKLKVEGFWT